MGASGVSAPEARESVLAASAAEGVPGGAGGPATEERAPMEAGGAEATAGGGMAISGRAGRSVREEESSSFLGLPPRGSSDGDPFRFTEWPRWKVPTYGQCAERRSLLRS
mmetsp:Transcript_21187/g.48665  ORF Transcript_21187/g.48665 Transcript_21187/m.48665 type:complete len:110 (+) Transcript_21187:110-439(+)